MTAPRPIFLIALAAAVALGVFAMRPRGLRNRNVGNIEYNPANQFEGQTGSDGRYAIFRAHPSGEYVYGLRALAKLLKNYASKYGINTVQGFISRFAPAHENPTGAYVKNVAAILGVAPTAPINIADPATLEKFITGVVRQEIGSRYARQVPAEQIRMGVALS